MEASPRITEADPLQAIQLKVTWPCRGGNGQHSVDCRLALQRKPSLQKFARV